jgi:hypothetical protein
VRWLRIRSGAGVRAHLRPGSRTPQELMASVPRPVRPVGERTALRHQPDQRRLLRRRRGAHGAQRALAEPVARSRSPRPCNACCST